MSKYSTTQKLNISESFVDSIKKNHCKYQEENHSGQMENLG